MHGPVLGEDHPDLPCGGSPRDRVPVKKAARLATYMEKMMMTKYHRQVRRIRPETHWLAPYTTPSFRKLLSISSIEPCRDSASVDDVGNQRDWNFAYLIEPLKRYLELFSLPNPSSP